MKTPVQTFALLLALGLAGCVSKSAADARAQAAFLAGQQEGMRQQQMQQDPARQVPPDTVAFRGNVRTPVLLWAQGLTLSKAIVQANYQGRQDPRVILIRRQGQILTVEPAQLLAGAQDPLLQPGDLVELVP